MTLSRRDLLKASIGTVAALSHLKVNAISAAFKGLGLKDLYKNDFLVGTMVKTETFMREDGAFNALLKRDFNALVTDNPFKWKSIHPTHEHWDWSYADQFVRYGERNNMHMTGHVLVWHSQNPIALFRTSDDKFRSASDLAEKMEQHITAVVRRYKDRVHAWDVVNEALDENGWVNNEWYQVLGEDYVANAFAAAHKADPNAVLLYNDYNLALPAKRGVLLDYLAKAKKQGVPIHAVGMQGHFSLDFPDLHDFEESIEAFAAQGLRVHVTELDVDVLPELKNGEYPDYAEALDPYRSGLPEEIEQRLAERYADIFRVLLRHSDKIDRVTVWGTNDGESWKNDFPIEGRVNYPLLFDRKNQSKPAYHAIAALKE